MMSELRVILAILAIGVVSYALRIGGFLAGGAVPQNGLWQRFLRLAPGNLCVAFAAAGILQGGWPSLFGCVSAVITMSLTNREWAALGAGFAATALTAALVR
jgi:branched-subunit amino acid transport protein